MEARRDERQDAAPTMEEMNARVDQRFRELEEKLTAFSEEERARVREAFRYGRAYHEGQLRKDGSPYITHPLEVAHLVAELGLDADSVMAALLHDTIEDTDATHEEVAHRFGATVADLVEGVTKLTRVKFSSTEEKQMENLRKMLMAMAKDIRVILIKICDRLHNMRTMEYQSPKKQREKALETMEIYAPIAHRLGMQRIKWELEDLSLKYLDPIGYKEIDDELQAQAQAHAAFMDSIQEQITARLEKEGIRGTVYGRVKHVYSIYRKMFAQNKNMEEIFDLYAFRVIVDDIPDCYNVLGHIHDMYKLVPGRFKDYISTPKPNMYQSLHTTVIGPGGHPLRGADPHLGYAPHGRVRRGGPLEVQAGPVQQEPGHRGDLRLGPPPAGEPAGHRGRGIYPQPEGGPLRRRGLRLHPQRGRDQPPRRGHPHRLCLRHPLRGGQRHDRSQGQRPHRGL